jgi:hypothetical protein
VLGAEPNAAAPFTPDPASVERYGPAYRYPQAGWIVLHVEGEPYERGYQHGRLLAPEIAQIVKAAATKLNSKGPEDGWSNTRMLVDALFLRRYEQEYLLEMKGIADGAASVGAKFNGRPLDLVDIVAINAWTEVEFLDAALDATPKGIEGVRFRDLLPTPPKSEPPSRCSSFIATGPATADGEIVFGHITMWSLYSAQHFNVWLDLKPAAGHRVLMQTFPGGIQSTTDYYFNDAGLLVSETTLAQTRFNIDGQAEASRIRKALQYADSIDGVVEILKTSNNGLYTNEWLIGDTKTNEIAMFELGTFKSRLYRSSRGEWFGGTPGFYWGCNNTKDLDVRLETVPSLVGQPANVVFRSSDRDLMWQKLYAKHRGKINESFAFEAFTTPPLAAAHSLDAKFTTADLARELKTWALFGPPLGRTWQPTDDERSRYSDIQPLVSNGWTLLKAKEPAGSEAEPPRWRAVDLASASWPGSTRPRGRTGSNSTNSSTQGTSGPAWHGTILPQGDGDIWLAAAFADYERVVAAEKAHGSHRSPNLLWDAARDRTNLAMFPFRSQFMIAARTLNEIPLADVRASVERNDWYDLAAGKGAWVLAELRGVMGDERFEQLMDSFGRDFAGQRVATAEFQQRAAKLIGTGENGEVANAIFRSLVRAADLPTLRLDDVKVSNEDSDWMVCGSIRNTLAFPTTIELLLETEGEPVTQTVRIGDSPSKQFELSAGSRPARLVLDPRNQRLKSGGAVFSVRSFERELEQSLIVYGTGPEAASLREAAELLQRRIATQWSNFSVPIKSDREVDERALGSHHLLLVGRPSMNSIVGRFRDALPVELGAGSFSVAGQTYAHPASAVIAAAASPLNDRYSLVLFAGLSAESTRRVVQASPAVCEVMVWPTGSGQQPLVLPARELIIEFARDAGASVR